MDRLRWLFGELQTADAVPLLLITACVAMIADGLWTLACTREVPIPLSPRPSPKALRRLPTPNHTGAIHLIMGPMFSGKTLELKRRIDVKRIASVRKQLKCVLIKYSKDTRYAAAGVLSTHNRIQDADCIAVNSLADCAAEVDDAQFVFIDEGQMFAGLAAHCLAWARQGREVTVAALDAYASQDLWPEIASLIPWCVSLQKLNAVCGTCGSDAPLSVLNSGRPAVVAEQKVGGKDLYDASCIVCCCSSA
jgi:thymidine kinase